VGSNLANQLMVSSCKVMCAHQKWLASHQEPRPNLALQCLTWRTAPTSILLPITFSPPLPLPIPLSPPSPLFPFLPYHLLHHPTNLNCMQRSAEELHNGYSTGSGEGTSSPLQSPHNTAVLLILLYWQPYQVHHPLNWGVCGCVDVYMCVVWV